MAPEHKDTLSVLDTSFLNLESGTTHMHVGGISIFDGPPPDCDELYAHIESRLHLVPRYRQKLAEPGFQLGRPMWIDDPCFALDYHVRHTALPRPGGRDKLKQLASRVFSQQLDRSKPLWEMWFAEGLEEGRWAIISKAHHALIDGMSGVDLLGLLFDPTPGGGAASGSASGGARPEPRAVEPPERAWHPRPAPSRAELVAGAAVDIATRPLRIAGRALGAVRSPRRTAAEVAEGAKGIRDVLVGPMLSPAPDVPLNQSIGPHRRVEWTTFRLDDFKAVKNELGGTVNDVVLAVVAGALREWLRARGTRVEGLELRAMVPVSVRAEGERNQFGNRVAAMRGPLPVYAADPVERLRLVTEAMQDLKASKQAVGAEVLANLQEFAPPTLLALGSRINFSTRLFNTVVTNVPGPQFPIYMLGREMTEMVPLGFLAANHTVFFAIMSYTGKLAVGLLGDRDVMTDLDEIASALERSLAELKRAAGIQDKPAARRARARQRAAAVTTTNGSGR